ncbi:XRE family transcriptional regulator [Streptomyces kanamyceticus]|uniref:XRE family transcriptional regulator n=2 Tax=Streptomyces kanamyceticus TaxID=1967 RepID=A0A5J6GMU4_STRKN|nr:helix-turn-helix transcriptional regulator [Streptomyces kanamyceticus]QEU95704.1 XRE family transcriptional regulator [Streptomyces kanamyceticus]
MQEQPAGFGSELRRARIAAGLTLTELAAAVHYSKGQISKVETGSKRPSPALARLCDAALHAHGSLSSLVPAASPTKGDPLDEMRHPPAGDGDAVGGGTALPSRRRAMTVGAVSLLGISEAPASAGQPDAPGNSLLEISRALFDQYRRLGQMAPASAVLPGLAEQSRSLCALAARTGPRTGRRLHELAARYAEYAGWMAEESGDDRAALRWTDRAVELADTAGDHDLASYALVRRALITYYQGNAADTIALAAHARAPQLPARIRGLAAQREAQGHALVGDYDSCMRGLDSARELLASAARDSGTPTLGTKHLQDPAAMITGWCLVDLGRPREAAEHLDRECARIPGDALRTQARYGVRRALAHAAAGEFDHACELTGRLLRTTDCVGSATITTDLRRLARILSRHPHRPAFLAISPHLTASLAPVGR